MITFSFFFDLGETKETMEYYSEHLAEKYQHRDGVPEDAVQDEKFAFFKHLQTIASTVMRRKANPTGIRNIEQPHESERKQRLSEAAFEATFSATTSSFDYEDGEIDHQDHDVSAEGGARRHERMVMNKNSGETVTNGCWYLAKDHASMLRQQKPANYHTMQTVFFDTTDAVQRNDEGERDPSPSTADPITSIPTVALPTSRTLFSASFESVGAEDEAKGEADFSCVKQPQDDSNSENC